ncbi:DNA polymerase III subunit gamma/tau [Roseococcus sp. SDR]|uniref:DNA polymerase III subunit gamma/tau n=1 Tax=Roseococcus sp. SDR TaxID=2835532 RepID=UPI001BCBB4E9|nr:DNA polymerase III subunit gamma/tau [Roseococcus sp. SDR]MBS7792608.1 DNA polymerase III subunit gamma/tau [Roseococcus sp. SDR]MBV1847922.1 DNA polymerase III subunit gamma/tau [Roseococcus sp. SDR]
MPSDLYGEPSPEEGLPEPPPPEGPGLFGFDDPPPAPAAAPAPPPVIAAAPAPAKPAPYRVLARKYRPQVLDDLIGQEALVRTLRNAFARGRVHHAFLLTGVRGVGKTTTARIIARALNCVGVDGKGGPTADPCGVCPECVAILADRHPDVVEMDAASNRGIDDVRELREALRFRPAQGRQKVFILDEVHMLTEQAFNALLKSLEEPPPNITFILATTELRKVPITIRSRCQTFSLKRVPEERLRGHFQNIAAKEHASLEEGAVAMLARAADGSVRDGLSLLDQAIALAGDSGAVTTESVRDMLGLADRALVFDILEAVMNADLPLAMQRMAEGHERGAEPLTIMQDLLEQTHMLTRFAAIPALAEDMGLPENERVRGAALAARLSVPMLTRAWQMLLKGLEEVMAAPDRRAAAEMVLIRLAHVAEQPTPGEILKRLESGGAVPAGGGAPAPGPNGGGVRMVAGGGAVAAVATAPLPTQWREIAAIASAANQALLHAHLLHDVHPVRIAPGQVEIRVRPQAPRDLGAQLKALLEERTGARWTVALSNAEGEPTLAEQSRAAETDRRSAAQSHPIVQAILLAFPGAQIDTVRDETVDEYGLKPIIRDEEPDFPEFAPPEAESAGFDLPEED